MGLNTKQRGRPGPVVLVALLTKFEKHSTRPVGTANFPLSLSRPCAILWLSTIWTADHNINGSAIRKKGLATLDDASRRTFWQLVLTRFSIRISDVLLKYNTTAFTLSRQP